MLISIKGKKGNLQFIIDEKEELPNTLGCVAGPVIQGNRRLSFEDDTAGKHTDSKETGT